MMTRARILTAAFVAAVALAPAAHAEWHGRGNWNRGYNNNAAGAAIVGGIVGLGLGAAIASGGYGGYYAPPPVYYGYPSYPNSYYYSAPPPVYYGYGYY